MTIFKNYFLDFEPVKDKEFVYNEEVGKRYRDGGEENNYLDYLIEQPAINWFKEVGCSYIYGSEVAWCRRKVIEFDRPNFINKGKIFYELLTNDVKLTFKEGKDKILNVKRRLKCVNCLVFPQIKMWIFNYH